MHIVDLSVDSSSIEVDIKLTKISLTQNQRLQCVTPPSTHGEIPRLRDATELNNNVTIKSVDVHKQNWIYQFFQKRFNHRRLQKTESLAYIVVADSIVHLSAFKFVHWAPKDASFCNRVRFGRSRSPRVDDFGTNRKRVWDFLFVSHCDYGPILHRFRDTATYWLKTFLFLLPLSHSVPSLPMFPLGFCAKVVKTARS